MPPPRWAVVLAVIAIAVVFVGDWRWWLTPSRTRAGLRFSGLLLQRGPRQGKAAAAGRCSRGRRPPRACPHR
jgi:hypothetical protein